tara:strand:+ start:167 stop:460 length:294 start_codon:yes stop_codon:yes gene_type:complete
MAIIKKFTGNTTDTDIVRKHIDKRTVSKVYIACTHDTVDLIVDRLYLDNGTTEYDIIANVKVPVGAAVDIPIPMFNYRVYDLKVTTTNSSNCTIIIR